MEIIYSAIVFGLGYFVGQVACIYQFRKSLKAIAEEAGIDLTSELQKLDIKFQEELKHVFKLETEQINGTLYLYNRETNDFICQGKTIEELANFAKKYKNINYASVIHGDTVYTFMNGEAKEFYEDNNRSILQ